MSRSPSSSLFPISLGFSFFLSFHKGEMREWFLTRKLGLRLGILPSLSSCPQVITPVRTGHGYVYEYPSRYQKDIYDIPPSHTTQGVCTRTVVSRDEEYFRATHLKGYRGKENYKLCIFHMKLDLGCLSRSHFSQC